MKRKLLLSGLIICMFSLTVIPQETANTATLDVTKMKYRISRNIYGHFSEHLGHCIYGGFWVGENSPIPNVRGIRKDVVDAMKRIKAPVLRWPGGCFADEYHWKDGIGPRSQRPSMINTNWGGVTEDNSFGTHEYMDLCEQIGCEPYVSGNLGSGTVQEMSQWVEYLNSDNVSPLTEMRRKNGHDKAWGVKFWGLGNESWGCGGSMKPEYYSNLANHFGNFCRNYGKYALNKIAVGPGGADYNWTDVVMREMGNSIWGLSLHHYTFASGHTATDINEDRWFDIINKTLSMEEIVNKHSAIMDKYDPGRSVALVVDEWGTWYSVEPGTNPGFLYQQNTLLDALVAGTNLNIFNNHCDRVRMAAVAQAINVLQSVILTKDEKMVLTPTYHVFDMYKVHQDAMMIPVTLKIENYTQKGKSVPSINCSASVDKEGKIHISICNVNPTKEEMLTCSFAGFTIAGATGQILTADQLNAHNTFENPNNIVIKEFKGFESSDKNLTVKMPPRSVVVLELNGKMETPKMAEIKNLEKGIQFNYFEGSWFRVPEFDNLPTMKTGILKTIALPERCADDNFGVSYNGYIEIPSDGMYDFFLTSDDGSKLFIDNEELVTNDGQHAAIERQGTTFLSKGAHSFKVYFFEAGGQQFISISIQGPGLAKQEIPEGMLFHQKGK
jgi:alpha-L-arabinofuranosidase